jgi:hypothetical protein
VIFKEDLEEIFGKRPFDKNEEVKEITSSEDILNDKPKDI